MHLADAPLEDARRDREVLVETLDAEDLAAFLGALVNLLLGRRCLGCLCGLAHAPAPTGSAAMPVRPSSSSAKWHAVRCAESSIGRSGGSSSRQRTRPCERKQRGWNGQPGGRLIRLGGWPGIGRSHSSSPVSFGRLSISPTVYGCRGDAKMVLTSPTSTTVPAYMTITRSASSAIRPRSCVIRIVAACVSCCAFFSTSRICA